MVNTQLDISSLEFSQNPYFYYALLRKHGNVHYLEKTKTWLVIGYEEIVEICKDYKTFTSTSSNPFDPILLNSDPPEHTKSRSVFMGQDGLFSQKNINKQEQENREIARNLIQKIKADKSFDALSDLALPFSSLIILNLLGIKSENNALLKEWTINSVSSKAIHDESYAQEHWIKLKPIITTWVEKASLCPHSGGLSQIINHQDLSKKFTKEDLINLTKVLLVGGNETTPNLVSSALLILLRDKELFEEIQQDKGKLIKLINETLRLESPTQIIQRTNTKKVVINNVTIPANSQIALSIGAANRDPKIFTNPDNFDLSRSSSKTIAFGYGPHHCIGAALAKQEALILLEELLFTFPHLELAHSFEAKYRHSSHVRGLLKMPLCTSVSSPQKLLVKAREKAINLIQTSLEKDGRVETLEYYPLVEERSYLAWHKSNPSPFVHANVAYSLMQADVPDTLIKGFLPFLLQTKEFFGLWRFWSLTQCENPVPLDIDDTAICSFVLEKMGAKMDNKKPLYANILKNGDIKTWILPSLSILFNEPKVYFALLKEGSIVDQTIKAGMLAKDDTEIGVSATALMYLGENRHTANAIQQTILKWLNKTDDKNFYEKEIIIAYHLARAFKEGISAFHSVKDSIVELIEKELESYSFPELLLASICLKNFHAETDLYESVKKKILLYIGTYPNHFESYAYFTSKNRMFKAGSPCLTAAWFLEASDSWSKAD